jgi:transcriptional regulator with XRE-family HTH domain
LPADESVPTLGAALREAREAAGLTVEQVSADTRIRATLVRDLEADRFASSGGTVYARGHVKSIAATLRIDAAPLLALFDQAQGEPVVEPLLAATPEPSTIGSSDFVLSKAASLRPERRGPRWGIALSGAAVVLVGLIAIGSLGGGATPHPSALSGTPTPTSEPTEAEVAPTQPAYQASLPPVTGAQLRVRVIGGTSWVSISSPTATLFEGTIGDGQFKDFHDPTKLKVVIGNAPVVSLNCNGRDSGPVAPNNHKVGHFSCTSTGLTSS